MTESGVSATEPADRLAGELGDQLEVFVAVPQLGVDRLRSGGSEEIDWRRTTVVPTLRKDSLHGASSFAQVGLEWNKVQRFVLFGELEQLGLVARGA